MKKLFGIICAGLLIVGCTKELTIEPSDQEDQNPVLGDYVYGGVVFWVDPNDNSHGMVCDLNDLDTAVWGCQNGGFIVNTASDNSSIGSGRTNTVDIAMYCGETNTAAMLCHILDTNGVNDWHLPSSNELYQLKLNRAVVNSTCIANGGSALLEDSIYWSSTESGTDTQAQVCAMNDLPIVYPSFKSFYRHVRAVRAY